MEPLSHNKRAIEDNSGVYFSATLAVNLISNIKFDYKSKFRSEKSACLLIKTQILQGDAT